MTTDQAALMGLIAYAIVQVIKVFFIGLLGLPKPSKLVFAVIALAVSAVVAYVYTGPVTLPDPRVDPLAFAQALVAAAGAIFAYASAFYFFLLDRFLAGLDSVTFAVWARRRVLAP